MIALKGIWLFLNSRIFPYILVGILLMLYLRGCNNIAKERIESDRRLGNYLASQDSIRILSTKNGTLLVEKSVFEKTIKELKIENSELYEELELEKKKPPKVIIETVIEYRDRFVGGTENDFNSLTNKGNLKFLYNPILPGKNILHLSGNIPYLLNVQDSLNPITFGEYIINIKQKIDIKTGLYRDPKEKRTYIKVFTDYPNITFDEIYAIDITDTDSKEAMKANRKEFGIGFNAGYGIQFNKNIVNTGPYIGVGLNYNPKFLQFGK